MKPNYSEMTFANLREYILKNRDDLEVIENFFVRRSPDSEVTLFPFTKKDRGWNERQEIAGRILEIR